MPKKIFHQAGKNQKVVIAMSGGVDSSVAAALLKEQGYDVVGVFMRFWKEGGGGRNACCSEGAEQAARNVAKKLNIPFYVLRLEKEFKKAVVDYFLAEENHGRTPNPCVICNKKIKFGLLFKKAMALGADFVATGHYARLRREFPKKSQNSNAQKLVKLFCGKDKDKDQSYFLYTLTQKELRRILFPLGDYTKDKVYEYAEKRHLPYRQGESFDLCFVSSSKDNFLKKYLKQRNGKIIGVDGKLLGRHDGLAHYTIGQRKNIPLQQGPWWVVKKDSKKNILYVSNNEKDLYGNEVIVTNINWLSGQPPQLPVKIWAKIRYKSDANLTAVSKFNPSAGGKNLKLVFAKPQRAPAPGQSAVFYSKTGEVLGGGIIR